MSADGLAVHPRQAAWGYVVKGRWPAWDSRSEALTGSNSTEPIWNKLTPPAPGPIGRSIAGSLITET
jgi:hypothetical protein